MTLARTVPAPRPAFPPTHTPRTAPTRHRHTTGTEPPTPRHPTSNPSDTHHPPTLPPPTTSRLRPNTHSATQTPPSLLSSSSKTPCHPPQKGGRGGERGKRGGGRSQEAASRRRSESRKAEGGREGSRETARAKRAPVGAGPGGRPETRREGRKGDARSRETGEPGGYGAGGRDRARNRAPVEWHGWGRRRVQARAARPATCPRPPHPFSHPSASGPRGGGASGPTDGAQRDRPRPQGAARDGERRRGVPRAAAGATRTPGGAASHAPRASTRGRPRRGRAYFSGRDPRAARGTPLLHREGTPWPGGSDAYTGRGIRARREPPPQPRTAASPPPTPHLGHATLARSFSSGHRPLFEGSGATAAPQPRDAAPFPPLTPRARRRTTDGAWGAGPGPARRGGRTPTGSALRGTEGTEKIQALRGKPPQPRDHGGHPGFAIDRQATLRQA